MFFRRSNPTNTNSESNSYYGFQETRNSQTMTGIPAQLMTVLQQMNFHNSATMSQHYKHFKEEKKKKKRSSSSSSSYKSEISKYSKKSEKSSKKSEKSSDSSSSSSSYQNKKYFDLKNVKSYTELERQNSKAKIKEDLRNLDLIDYEKKHIKRTYSKSHSSSSSKESEPVYIQKENDSYCEVKKDDHPPYRNPSEEKKKLYINTTSQRNGNQSSDEKYTKNDSADNSKRKSLNTHNEKSDEEWINNGSVNINSECSENKKVDLQVSSSKEYTNTNTNTSIRLQKNNDEIVKFENQSPTRDNQKNPTDKFNSDESCPNNNINGNLSNSNSNSTLSMRRKPFSNFSDSPPVKITEKIQPKRISNFSSVPPKFSSIKSSNSAHSTNLVEEKNNFLPKSRSNLINPNMKLKIINEYGKKKIILNKNRKISDILIVKRDGNNNK
jgi:hypothetical protein